MSCSCSAVSDRPLGYMDSGGRCCFSIGCVIAYLGGQQRPMMRGDKLRPALAQQQRPVVVLLGPYRPRCCCCRSGSGWRRLLRRCARAHVPAVLLAVDSFFELLLLLLLGNRDRGPLRCRRRGGGGSSTAGVDDALEQALQPLEPGVNAIIAGGRQPRRRWALATLHTRGRSSGGDGGRGAVVADATAAGASGRGGSVDAELSDGALIVEARAACGPACRADGMVAVAFDFAAAAGVARRDGSAPRAWRRRGAEDGG